MDHPQIQQTTNWLISLSWPVILLGGVGAFIDFILGTAGQTKLKDWLQVQWIKFDDLKWSNFSVKEARYFVDLFDVVFGARFFSVRRISVCLSLTLISISFAFALAYYGLETAPDRFPQVFTWNFWYERYRIGANVVIIFLSFSASLSLTRWLSVVAIGATERTKLGPVVYFALVLVHIGLFLYLRPVVDAFRFTVIDMLTNVSGSGDYELLLWAKFYEPWWRQGVYAIAKYKDYTPVQFLASFREFAGMAGMDMFSVIDDFIFNSADQWLAFIASGIRLLMAFLFLAAFVLRRWFTPFLSLIWRRIVEDQKGAFTIFLGGVGAVASVVKEIATHF